MEVVEGLTGILAFTRKLTSVLTSYQEKLYSKKKVVLELLL